MMTEMQLARDTTQQFVDAVKRLQRGFPDHTLALALGVASRLAALLETAVWVPATYRRGWPDHYQQRVVHVAPDRRWSLTAVLWQPEHGPARPLAWCAIGRDAGAAQEAQAHVPLDSQAQSLDLGDDHTLPDAVVILLEPEIGAAARRSGARDARPTAVCAPTS